MPTRWRVVGSIGRVFVSVGVIVVLFVGYQLWGTDIAARRAQDSLRSSFTQTLQTSPSTTPRSTATSTPAPSTTTATTAPAPEQGEPVAVLRIPRIGVDQTVVEGVGTADLQKGPGHYPSTPLPGAPGNSGIAGHRTTYGAPFGRLDELVGGDLIAVTTASGSFYYSVTTIQVVAPTDVAVLAQGSVTTLTLTTCHPRYSAKQRLVVTARLVAPTPAQPTTTTTTPASGGQVPSTTVPPGAFDAGLEGDSSAAVPTVLWGAIAAAIAIGAMVGARRWRRWASYAIALVPFLVALFVFFEQLARLLPPTV
jgi:sortase A